VSEEQERWVRVADGPDFEVSWDGNFRSRDRKSPTGRSLKGKKINPRIGSSGYPQVDYVNAEGKRVTEALHVVMLKSFVPGGIPKGMESRHHDDVPTHNVWRPGGETESLAQGGNLFIGRKRDQHQDKVRNNGGKPLPVPPPSFDCVNHGTGCAGKARNPGKRCVGCVEQLGRDAAAMLREGENLTKVMRRFGFTDTRWVFSVAQKHGGYTGTKEQALAQHRGRLRRVTSRFRRGGDSQSPQASAGAGTAPFGRLPQVQNVGQSRTSETRNVAERNGYERSPAPPLPADVTHRERRPFGRARNR
jgi:hypothetical protein